MVVKTELCVFSELKIYPGKGVRFMTKDCKLPVFLNQKCCNNWRRKVKPQKIRWCVAWRRANKKLQATNNAKKRKRKARKVVREIVGMNLEEFSKKKNETREERDALREKAIREIKDRKKKVAQQNKPAQGKNNKKK